MTILLWVLAVMFGISAIGELYGGAMGSAKTSTPGMRSLNGLFSLACALAVIYAIIFWV